MDTSGRLLRLLSLLQARPGWRGRELSDRLGVTDRTLRRDVARLRDLGYPVEASTGPHGGYRLIPGGVLPPLLLEDDEAVAVALALRSAATGGLPGMEDPAVASLAKIEQVLPARLRDRIETLASATVRLGPPAPGPVDRLQVETLVTIARACRAPERLRFTYTDGAGAVTERHVEPLQLVHAAMRWYLVARDRDREAWRSFRVDRIARPTPTGMRVVHRDPPDAAAFVAEGVAVGAYRHHARVILEVPPATARRFVPPTVGVLEPAGEEALLRLGGDELEWIARFLAGLPCRFRVLEPVELRGALAELADRLGAAAKG